MNGKNIKFDNKISKKQLLNKNKKISNIGDIDVNKILVSKTEQCGKHNSMLLDHYTYFFHKLLDILINLIKIK